MIASDESTIGAVVKATTRFGLNLLHELATPTGDAAALPLSKNIFISPFSVAAALTLVYNGASGETREAMARVLGFDGLSQEEINQAYYELLEMLTSPHSEMQLAIANSLWVRTGVPVKPEYIEGNRSSFHAEITVADFNSETVKTINDWVRGATHGKIDRIIQKLDPLSILVGLNAVYFKGIWVEQFQPHLTNIAAFTRWDGQQKLCAMMHLAHTFGYHEDEDLQAIRLPYRGGRASMYVFLPSRDFGLDRFLARMSAEKWDTWLNSLMRSEQEVHLHLPRFKIEYNAMLNEPLQKLGMQAAFDREHAEFDEMCTDCPEKLFISEVRHKTYVDVDEQGTEAVAAVDWSMRIAGIFHGPEMEVDHPFFLAIRDDQTGVPLFAGAIVDLL